jgi:hypothetical protein
LESQRGRCWVEGGWDLSSWADVCGCSTAWIIVWSIGWCIGVCIECNKS